MSDGEPILWQTITNHIVAATGIPFRIRTRQALSGGCIHQAWKVCDDGNCFFVKTNLAEAASLFAAEQAGLEALREARAVRVPSPVALGQAGAFSFLILEYIDLRPARGVSQVWLGKRLAALHRSTQGAFGWHQDNVIGSTPQPNTWENDWITFWREHRLRHQFALAQRQGLHLPDADDLLRALPEFFQDYRPIPSLLHGDLWGGNVAADPAGEPVLFDPACYYGDREADLAFTEMFGGFSPEFYEAYAQEWPLSAGYGMRKRLYNLYHELNHFVLFGGGYGHQAHTTLQHLLAAI